MAAMAKKLSLSFFLLFLLTLSSTLHARESQFFAKVSNKESQPFNTNQQDPTFTPQTTAGDGDASAYGLYGHGSGQLPPSSTTTTTTVAAANDNGLPANLPENYNPVAYTTPIHSSTQDLPQEFNENEPRAYKYNGESSMYNSQKQDQFVDNGENIYNSEKQVGTNGGGMYNSEKQGKYYYAGDDTYNSGKQVVGETRLMDSENGGKMYNNEKRVIGYYNGGSMYNTEKQGMGYNNGGNMYNTQKQGMGYNNGGNMYNTQKQGMSDTRFLESGKYYYDVNSENLNANGYSRGVRNGFDTKGYYGNNDNSYDRYNSNGGYQNQEEYQENQEDQFNP